MPAVEIGLGLLVALSGAGAGWIGRGKYDEKLRANAATTKKVPSERRKAGGAKAAATRKAKAEAKAAEQANKAPGPVDLGLVQRQQFQGSSEYRANGAAVDSSMYGRGELGGGREQA